MNTVKSFADSRGTLLFPIKYNKNSNDSDNNLKECTYSINNKNVFRGLHINTFGKIITCISGSFIDIIVNLDTLIPEYFTIKQGEQVYCPENYAHGFLSLEDNSILSYFIDSEFDSEEGLLLNYKDPILNIQLHVSDSNLIINDKDLNAPFLHFDYFLLGSNGYIGSTILKTLVNNYKRVYCIENRMNELESIGKLIDTYKPKYFINAAGLTGEPNTKWCNTNKKQTLITNVIDQINILNLCNTKDVHCTIIGSGAIYKESTELKSEEDLGDLTEEYYSECRIQLENLIKNFDNYLYLRINYPISSNSNPKNLLTKLLKYTNIDDINLSISNLDSLLSILPDMLNNNETGIFNFISGNINIKTILDYYSEYNTELSKNYTISDRPTTKLDNSKIEKYLIETINDSIINLVKNYK